MFNHSFFSNTRGQGMGWMEILSAVAGHQPNDTYFVPLRRSELEGVVWGPLASLRITQVFSFQRQQCDQVIEAVYRFPLPGDAAVKGVVVQFGDAQINACLAERQEAGREYEAARSDGRAAALLCKEGLSVFTLQVTGIQPDQEVIVTTELVVLAQAEGTGWQLRFPVTVAPRFSRGDESGAQTCSNPLLVAHDPGHTFGIRVVFAGDMLVDSPTHQIHLEQGQNHCTAVLLEALPDRDLVLCWKSRQETERAMLQVVASRDEGGETALLALVAPPDRQAGVKTLPREVTVLVDHSGSMDGAKKEAADWTVGRFLDSLQDHDHFNVGVFDDRVRWFGTEPVPGGTSHTRAAVEFLGARRDGGGTNLGVALEQAMPVKAGREGMARHILVVTDAQVTDENRLIQVAERCYAGGSGARVSLICIDSAPNDFLVRSIAAAGGGAARFVTANPNEGDITTALDAILKDWDAPVYQSLRLAINQPGITIAGRDVIPRRIDTAGEAVDLGDLPAGRSVWLAGKFADLSGDDIILTLLHGREEILERLVLDRAAFSQSNPAVESLVSAWRLMALEQVSRSYHAPVEICRRLQAMGIPIDFQGHEDLLYPENRVGQSRDMLKDIMVAESLASGLLCTETAWLAVREEKGQKAEVKVRVASALPGGWEIPGSIFGIDLGGAGNRHHTNLLQNIAAPGSFRSRLASLFSSPAELDVPCFIHTSRPRASGSRPAQIRIYQGSPAPQARQLIYDSLDQCVEEAAGNFHFTGLEAEITGDAGMYDRVELWIYIDDPCQPAAVISIPDLVKQGGRRPLNLFKPAHADLRVFMVMPGAAEECSGEALAPITLHLHCRMD